MMTSNGGQVLAHDDVWNLHAILDTSDRKHLKRSCNDILRETEYMRDRPGWPENALAIGEPTIYVWLHDTDEVVAVAEVFSDLKRWL